MLLNLIYRDQKGAKLNSEEMDANFRALVLALTEHTPSKVAQSYAGWIRSSENNANDQSWIVLASVTVPAGTMGPNSKLVVITDGDAPSSASTKTFGVDFGGSNIGAPTLSGTSITLKSIIEIQNLGSLTSQSIANSTNFGAQTNARVSTTKDTEQGVVIDFKVKWSAPAATENITLRGYSIWHYPGS